LRGLAAAFLVALLLTTAGCGYHVAGSANVLPSDVHTIAVTPWRNISTQYKISDYIAEAVSRELITRTKYQVIADPAKADAVLSGAIANLYSGATVSDPIKGATAAQLVVQIQVKLTGKDGMVIFERPNIEFRERYEISVDPKQYFDESQVAAERLSRDVGHTIVSAILEAF
jgi:outer membrane lipopolysaccharide assembly protein LptE/RlpB